MNLHELADEIMFKIQKYGYARREGTHQGKTSAEWHEEIETDLRAALAERDEGLREALRSLALLLPPTAILYKSTDSPALAAVVTKLRDDFLTTEERESIESQPAWYGSFSLASGASVPETHLHSYTRAAYNGQEPFVCKACGYDKGRPATPADMAHASIPETEATNG